MIVARKPGTRPNALILAWAAVLLVLALLVGGYYLAVAEEGAYQNSLKANEYRIKARTAYRELINMETSERGYIITADESFSQQYEAAQKQLPELWAYLTANAGAVEPQPVEGQSLAGLVQDLRTKAETWQREAAEPEINLRRAGRTQEAFSRVASETSQALFEDVRTAATRLEDHITLAGSAFSNEANRLSDVRQGLLIVVGALALAMSILAARIAQQDRKLQAHAVRAAEAATERLRTIIENLPVAVRLLSAPRGDVILQNQAASLLIPADIWNSLEPEQRPSHFGFSSPQGEPLPLEELPGVRALREGVATTHFEFTLDSPETGAKHILASAAPLRDEQGNVVAAVMVMQDVTRMKELDQRKDEFIATAAHELRNPLTSIRGYNQLLLRYLTRIDVAPDAMRYAQRTSDQIGRLNGLVERLLDASRIQLGRLVLEKSEFDLVDIARTVAANAEAALDGVQAQQNNLSAQEGHEEYEDAVAVQGPPEGVKGEWDAVRVEQVLTNLVDNALRYSPPGTGVEVRVSRRGMEACVEVADRGPGVPAEQRPALFDRYYQGRHDGYAGPALPAPAASQDPANRASRRGSLGLGLHISSEIVKAHGGRIGMEPNPGGGSIFWFTLPLGSGVRDQGSGTKSVNRS